MSSRKSTSMLVIDVALLSLYPWVYTSSVNCFNSTTTVTDKLMGKVVGEPYRGKPDLRFDEGTRGRKVWQSA